MEWSAIIFLKSFTESYKKKFNNAIKSGFYIQRNWAGGSAINQFIEQ